MIRRFLAVVALALAPAIAATQDHPAPDPTAVFRIADFNVNGGYKTAGGTWNERLPLIVDTMIEARASVYLLQEAHEEQREHKQILAELKRRTHDRWVLLEGDGGNHIIADGRKHKLIRTNVYELPHDRHYVETNLWHAATGVRWWAWNTHLIASDDSRGRTREIAAAMRADQSEFIAEKAKRLWRCIGGGDANDGDLDPGSLRYYLAEVHHSDVREFDANVTNGHLNTWDGYRPNKATGRWIDMLAAGRLAQVRNVGLVDSGMASDHNLIWATAAITGPETNLLGG